MFQELWRYLLLILLTFTLSCGLHTVTFTEVMSLVGCDLLSKAFWALHPVTALPILLLPYSFPQCPVGKKCIKIYTLFCVSFLPLARKLLVDTSRGSWNIGWITEWALTMRVLHSAPQSRTLQRLAWTKPCLSYTPACLSLSSFNFPEKHLFYYHFTDLRLGPLTLLGIHNIPMEGWGLELREPDSCLWVVRMRRKKHWKPFF